MNLKILLLGIDDEYTRIEQLFYITIELTTYIRSSAKGGRVEDSGHSSELAFGSVISSHFRVIYLKELTWCYLLSSV